jgi:hypothetical protein
MTWRRLYVPQVGHAMCGSLGSRHCGQRTRVGAEAFHWARRDLVLLRDILRLGTATSVLLTCLRYGRAVRGWLHRDLTQSCPPGVQGWAMVVAGARLGKPCTAFGTQPGAVFLAPRRKRQRENQSIAEDRLEIEQIPVQRVPARTGVPAVLLITEQFLAPDLDGLGHRFQAPRTLPRHRPCSRGGDEHALADGLQADLKIQFGVLRDPGHAGVQMRRSGHGPGFGARRSRAAVKRPGVEDQQPTGVGAGAGSPAE